MSEAKLTTKEDRGEAGPTKVCGGGNLDEVKPELILSFMSSGRIILIVTIYSSPSKKAPPLLLPRAARAPVF